MRRRRTRIRKKVRARRGSRARARGCFNFGRISKAFFDEGREASVKEYRRGAEGAEVVQEEVQEEEGIVDWLTCHL